MDKLFEREGTAFTLNSAWLSQYKNDFLAYYKSCRQRDLNGIAMDHIQDYSKLEASASSASTLNDNAVGRILSNLNKINIRDVKASDLPKLHRDPFDAALEVMATVSAYYQGELCTKFCILVCLTYVSKLRASASSTPSRLL